MQVTSDTRQRLIQAARELMAASSYAEASVARICDVAGAKKGSFYHFFPSKRDLTITVLEGQYLDFKAAIADRAFSRDISPLARITRFGEMIYQFQKSLSEQLGYVPGCPFGSIAAEMAVQDPKLRETLAHIFSRLEGLLRNTLKEAVMVGEARSMNIAATAKAMFAYLEGIMLLAKNANDPEVLHTLLPVLIQIRIEEVTTLES
jgi:TetR/AcrR family transcriptional regulator, transcriptional repressor for nem operon